MKGFAFTFDSFVAFILAIALIYGLFIFISVPSGYYAEFEQTYLLAKDTATMLRYAEFNDENITYLDKIASSFVDRATPDTDISDEICNNIRKNIPKQYAFKMEYFNSTANNWTEFGGDCNQQSFAGYYCSEYRKARASAPIIMTAYSVFPDMETNQFGYESCSGNFTPCGEPPSMANIGDIQLRLLRLTVCT